MATPSPEHSNTTKERPAQAHLDITAFTHRMYTISTRLHQLHCELETWSDLGFAHQVGSYRQVLGRTKQIKEHRLRISVAARGLWVGVLPEEVRANLKALQLQIKTSQNSVQDVESKVWTWSHSPEECEREMIITAYEDFAAKCKK